MRTSKTYIAPPLPRRVEVVFCWLTVLLSLQQQIDFVVWTGDSARHDNDVHIPRTSGEIADLNEQVVNKMVEVFGNSSDPVNPITVPIVPTLGNNDIYPHNIMLPGPSKLTHDFVELWKPFIPENQYHVVHKGAYFWQQVVPGRNGKMGDLSEGGLVVFSLNTLYAFDGLLRVGAFSDQVSLGTSTMQTRRWMAATPSRSLGTSRWNG